MPETDWQVVVRQLRRMTSGPSREQVELANYLGMQIPAETPTVVAAALLREPLREVVGLPDSQCASDNELTYLQDLANEVGISIPPEIETRDLVDAWIIALYACRAAESLERLRPAPQDVVQVGDASLVGEVSSISADGRLNFRGGGGRGIRPHRASIAARPGEPAYEELWYLARQQTAAAKTSPEDVGPGQLKPIEKWRVTGEPGLAARAALENALAFAVDERPLEKVLEEHPTLLSYLVTGHHGAYVIPQKELGSEYVPDFLVAGYTSLGLRWTLVELESPTAPLAIEDGQAERRVRKGMKQISDWREWLADNIDYARKSRADNGLGLPGIRVDAQGLVLVSRGDVTTLTDRMRTRVSVDQRIEIRTYDWLVRVSSTTRRLPQGFLDMEIAMMGDADDMTMGVSRKPDREASELIARAMRDASGS